MPSAPPENTKQDGAENPLNPWRAFEALRPSSWRRRSRQSIPHFGPVVFAIAVLAILFVLYITNLVAENTFQNLWNHHLSGWLAHKRTGATATNAAVVVEFLALLALVATAAAYYGRYTGLDQQLVQFMSSDQDRQPDRRDALIGALRRVDAEHQELMDEIVRPYLAGAAIPRATVDAAVVLAVESLLRRAFEVLDKGTYFRAGVYLPDPKDPDYLVIRWDSELGHKSREVNRWYIGDKDPDDNPKLQRGLPGAVFRRGRSAAVEKDIEQHPDYRCAYDPPRPALPYESALFLVVCSPNETEKYGVLAIDSPAYRFKDQDRYPMDTIALKLGALVKDLQDFEQVVGRPHTKKEVVA